MSEACKAATESKLNLSIAQAHYTFGCSSVNSFVENQDALQKALQAACQIMNHELIQKITKALAALWKTHRAGSTTQMGRSVEFLQLAVEKTVDNTPRYHRMSPGIADQLLLLIDEVEELTMEIFMSVQNQTPSDNLVEMLIKKDRELAQLLQVANEQKQLYDKIENYKGQIKKYDTRILDYQSKLLEAEGLLRPVLHQAKERLRVIKSARQNKVNSEEIVRYSHKISACHATSSPIDWVPGNPKRPYPTDVDMRAGILSQFTATGFIQPNAGVGGPGGGAGGDKGDNKQVPPAQLGTDGLAAVMTASGDGNPVNSIGNTWRNRGSVTEMPEEANMTINFGSPGGVISSSDSSDSSIGD